MLPMLSIPPGESTSTQVLLSTTELRISKYHTTSQIGTMMASEDILIIGSASKSNKLRIAMIKHLVKCTELI